MANFEIKTNDGGFISYNYVSGKNYKDAFLKVYSIDTAKLRYNAEGNFYYYKEGNTFLVEIKSA